MIDHPTEKPAEGLRLREVLNTWWPLAGSWLLMASELPAVSAVVARLADPEIHLAAYGSVVFPISLVIEGPVIMLLAASTALSRDWDSYLRLRRFMTWLAAGLTAVHVLVAATPLYHIIVGDLMNAPEAVRGPARIGLLVMTPWTASIAYRRFQQGVLIRFDRSRLVGVGTLVRLAADLTVLTLGYLAGSWPGVVVASGAVVTGVVAEAIFVRSAVRPIIRDRLRRLVRKGDPLTPGSLLAFYVPLALTALLHLLALPIYSAGLGRMPLAIASLATWPVLTGLTFFFRAVGLSYNEVVVALIDRPGGSRTLFRFTWILAGVLSAVMLLLAVTPLGWTWFADVSGLEDPLARLGRNALRVALLLPLLGVLQSWYTGILVQSRRTRGVPEAVLASLATVLVVLYAGAQWGRWPGIYVGVTAHVLGNLVQVSWLWFRSRGEVRAIRDRDLAGTAQRTGIVPEPL